MDYGRWLRAQAAQHALDVEQVRAGMLAGRVEAADLPAEALDAMVRHDALVEDDDG